MQPIERYGLVALLFLVVTTVAVVAWDGPGTVDNTADGTPGVAEAAAPKTGRSGDLGVAPVQQNDRTNVDRKPAPTVDPRAEELARLEAARRAEALRASEVAQLPTPVVQNTPQEPNPFSGSLPVDAGASNNDAGLAAAPPVSGLVEQQPTPTVANAPGTPPAAGGLPSGPFVLTKTSLGEQLAQEYGKDFKLYGPNGLVAAFEQANPGLDTTRLAANAQLVRPPAERIAAARKSNAVVVASDGTRSALVNGAPNAARTEEPLPPGARELNAVNVTPTVDVAARTHTVAAGETASSIAAKYLGDRNAYMAIARANPGVDINRIREGQVLVIPSSADAARPTAVAANTNTPPANAANATKKATGPRIK
jgi:LysM repeat protein